MARTKTSYSGVARGVAENHKNHTELLLDQQQAIELIRHIAEALRYGRGAVVNVHYGRRTGRTRTNRVAVKTP